MVAKTEAEKALDEREKAIAAREKDVAAREKALPKEPEPEDTTPTPTQAEIDEIRKNMGAGDAATYQTREAKAG